ncbi:YegP family protein [Elizabethkingia meningoseptica]|uniref:YegP family protein n=1 Tax=Elizabethkingia meningoseptica TaxID=238 RepID=UPI0022F16F57|nr:YegP family protein [Elizabethkingia meningoseptica]EJK5329993.1 YegP family protein [Elizabethkingia meningoseptica]WBS73853.1 YegP family protein [Elizabethkingia meningoseptica]
MGKFEISKRKNGEYQFNLKAGNGQVILTSEGYSTKANCENGVASVKKNSQDDSKFESKTSSNGKYYFNLKATNGQIIGTSEMYESSSGRDNGIESVKSNAPGASIDDITNN